jgi:rod shape determining protein RodA
MKRGSSLRFDIILLASAVFLMTVGIIFIYSSGVTAAGIVFSNEYLRQIIWVGTGLIFLIGITFFDYGRLKEWIPYIYVFFLSLLVLTLFVGRVVNGARSWLGPSGFGIQPSEFAKVATILMLAVYLERTGRRITEIPRFLFAALIAFLPLGLILIQPDLGTAIVYIPIFLSMIYIAGAKTSHIIFILLTGFFVLVFTVLPAWQEYALEREILLIQVFSQQKFVVYILFAVLMIFILAMIGFITLKKRYFYWIMYGVSISGISLLGSMLAKVFLKDYQIMRLIIFLDPYVDPLGSGWNIIQSKTAVGSGGLIGKGFLEGTQSHYQYLPQQSTDFIFSIFAEEWGFLGVLILFTVFGIILMRGLVIVNLSKDKFGSLLGAGILSMFAFHFIVNIGMAIGIMPVTGIPLFFMSYGGSSLWTGALSIGLLMSIYQHRYRY